MRASSGRHLLQSWLSMNTLRCHIAIDRKNLRGKLCSSKSIVLNNIVKRVKPFGKVVVIDLPYDVQVKPTCPHEYPDMDTVLVKLVNEENFFETQMKDNLICINVTDEACEIRMRDEGKVQVENVKCFIQTPVCYDVDVKTLGNGNVKVYNMISDFIAVQTEFGSIMGSGLQAKKITLSSSEGGSVTIEKSIQGDIEINTAKDGFVDVEKCLGTKLDISTENGSIKLGSNYCEKGTFTTLNGDLNLNNLHMDNSIDIHGKGNLSISCLDGSLEANIREEGSAKIQLARVTKDSVITSNGEIKLTIPEKINTKLILKSPILEIDQRLEGICYKNKEELIGRHKEKKTNITTTCTVESTKRVQIEQSSWMETFKLQNTPK